MTRMPERENFLIEICVHSTGVRVGLPDTRDLSITLEVNGLRLVRALLTSVVRFDSLTHTRMTSKNFVALHCSESTDFLLLVLQPLQ